MGSHPETVNIDASGVHDRNKWIFTENDAAVRAVQAIRNLNVKDLGAHLISELLPLLQRARIGNAPFLKECTVSNVNSAKGLQPIISLFQCAKKSKLKLKIRSAELSNCWIKGTVEEISNAPFGTFTEIEVDMKFDVSLCEDDNGRYMNRTCHNLATKQESHSDHEVVRNVIMRGIDAAENWVNPWMTFDENRMKQIGLRALDITFRCTVAQHFRRGIETV